MSVSLYPKQPEKSSLEKVLERIQSSTIFKIAMILLNRLDDFLMAHRVEGIVVCLFAIGILLTVLFVHIFGGSTLESGNYFNHLKDVI